MKKKILLIILSLVMILGYSFSTLADTIDSSGGTENQDVTATYSKNESENVLSVTITWGDLKYKYDDNLVWNSGVAAYVPDSTDGILNTWSLVSDPDSDKKNALISIQNDSNKKVNAQIDFAEGDHGITETDLTAAFYSDKGYTESNEVQTGTPLPIGTAADTEVDEIVLNAYLKITCTPTKINSTNVINGSILGTVKVTITE